MYAIFAAWDDFSNSRRETRVLKPHLLRHSFATHAVQVEKIPLGIVGEWLKQKSLDVTDYYSQPTESMVAEAAETQLTALKEKLSQKKQ
ncbi:MAG: hypothetical protein NVS4B11_38080 [Ktedonobacteraceae bacterium]